MSVPSGLRPWLLALAVAVVAVGCHKKDSVVPPVSPTATPSPVGSPTATPTASPTPTPAPTLPPTSAQAGITVTDAGGSQGISGGPGSLGGILAEPTSSSSGTVTGTLLVTTNVPTLPSPAPTGTALAAFELQLNSGWVFGSTPYVSEMMLPNGFSTTGLVFYESIYDISSGVSYGQLATSAVTNDDLTFAAPAATGTFTVNALDTYAFVLSSAPTATTPTGSPVKY
ncbi:MAG TPA: hypothetical protein VMD91_06805 [Candidatus Sulfotelmatobacter sp.]|nr:hypothetical protein [Candidatus Sulfotelmatobacter sp.]